MLPNYFHLREYLFTAFIIIHYFGNPGATPHSKATNTIDNYFVKLNNLMDRKLRRSSQIGLRFFKKEMRLI